MSVVEHEQDGLGERPQRGERRLGRLRAPRRNGLSGGGEAEAAQGASEASGEELGRFVPRLERDRHHREPEVGSELLGERGLSVASPGLDYG
jgi:hypothetical protein